MSKNIENDGVTRLARTAVKREIEKKQLLGQPVYIYDSKDKVIYQEYKDGTRVKVADRMRKGRYSEQLAEKKEKA